MVIFEFELVGVSLHFEFVTLLYLILLCMVFASLHEPPRYYTYCTALSLIPRFASMPLHVKTHDLQW